MNDYEEIKDTRFAKVAYYVAYIPVVGILLFILFGFIALQRITYRGRSGFNLLAKGARVLLLINILFFSLIYYFDNYYFLGCRKHTYESNIEKDMEKSIKYFSNGQISLEEARYKNIFYKKAFYENGQIRVIKRYIETPPEVIDSSDYWEAVSYFKRHYVVHGKSFSYHKNGRLSRAADFQQGVPLGPLRYYDKNGNLEEEETYAKINGRLIRVSATKYVDGKPVLSPQ